MTKDYVPTITKAVAKEERIELDNGFEYDLLPMSDLSKKTKYDEMCEINKIPIQICGHSLLHIIGTNIDWNSDIMSQKFIFENPNAANKCGCGTSFISKNL